MRRIILISLLLFAIGSVSAQENNLFIPTELQQAYEKGTRSYSGKPGANYFQNRSNYTIRAEFDPETGIIQGSEKIIYTNNSPDSLNFVVIRLYMNFFKRGSERDFGVPPFDLHDGIEINSFSVEGKKLNTNKGPKVRRDMGTVQMIELPEPMEPGSKTELKIDWEVQLPRKVAIRMGQYGDNNWFVAYWYPQIAVYDDISGWDTHLFTGSAEFYNDFSDFDVTLKLPPDYMVWATGILQNPEEHYTNTVLNRFEKAHRMDSVVNIVTKEDIEQGNVLKTNNTWHFIAEHVPDFAFAVSPDYLWDGTSILLDSSRKERVFVDAVYKEDSKDFHKVAGLSRKIIQLFSEDVMQADYPYPELTAFNGRGGMEFPMMINDGDASNHEGTVHLTAHEIGHNYFPFYVMTNESYYAFMDEGLISFLPRIAEERLLEDYDPFEELVDGYEYSAGSMKELPLMVKSYMISDYSAYRTHAYTRPGVAFFLLRDMLGEKDFNKALKAYVERWRWKHPTPYDFFLTFEEVLDLDLTWFWKPWFFEFGYPDLAIRNLVSEGNSHEVEIIRKGNMPVPIVIKVKFKDGTEKTIRREAFVWKDGGSNYKLTFSSDKNIKTIELGSPRIPDIYKENNLFKNN